MPPIRLSSLHTSARPAACDRGVMLTLKIDGHPMQRTRPAKCLFLGELKELSQQLSTFRIAPCQESGLKVDKHLVTARAV